MPQVKLESGLRGILSHEVTCRDLATNWRNDVPVLATPTLLWLAELACIRTIEGTLEPGKMTLGFAHEMHHLAPTPLGWLVQLQAVLTKIDGRLLTFEVEATDSTDTVLNGYHTRAIVDRDRFITRVESKVRKKLPTLSSS